MAFPQTQSFTKGGALADLSVCGLQHARSCACVFERERSASVIKLLFTNDRVYNFIIILTESSLCPLQVSNKRSRSRRKYVSSLISSHVSTLTSWVMIFGHDRDGNKTSEARRGWLRQQSNINQATFTAAEKVIPDNVLERTSSLQSICMLSPSPRTCWHADVSITGYRSHMRMEAAPPSTSHRPVWMAEWPPNICPLRRGGFHRVPLWARGVLFQQLLL